MDCSSERDFLSGIEPLSSSEISTPHNSKLNDSTDTIAESDSLNSTSDSARFPLTKPGFSPSPVKPLSAYSSPIVTGNSASFTTTAQEITKHIQESLTSSMKLEKEAEACLSPSLNKSYAQVNKSPSQSRTTLSVSPSKSISPSKMKVRFEHEAILRTEDLNPVCVDRRSSFQSPVKTSRQDHIFTSPPSSKISPTKKNYGISFAEMEVKKTMDVSRNLADSFLLNSLHLPQNNEEREKLFEFMKNMETSAAGDQFSSLFALGSEMRTTELSIPSAVNARNKIFDSERHSKEPESKHVEKHTAFKGIKKKQIQKKIQGGKETDKKVDAKFDAKEPPRKNGLVKKNVQKKSLKEKKPMRPDKTSVPSNMPSALYTKEGEQTIGGMEMIRNHLQGMLKMDGLLGCTPEVAEDYKLCFGTAEEAKNIGDAPDSFRSTDTATLLSVKPSDFMPPSSSPDSSTGNVDALINSATSSIFNLLRVNPAQPATIPSRVSADSSVAVENNILRDTLEKERYRRNHCEKQIQKLQNRILEVQQELAVGQSVARKKDMMIEQLDKTLSKVVDGWKIHEQKLVKTVEDLDGEKEKLIAERKRYNKNAEDLHTKLSKVTEELSNTEEKLLLREEEQKLLQQTFQMKTREISRVIDQKNSALEKLLNDKQAMVEDINELTKKMEEIQEATDAEKKKFSKGLLQQQRKLEDQLQLQKTRLEQEKSKNVDLQKMLSTTQREVTRLEDLMGPLRQTIDSLKMQGSLEETKYTAALRKMEAEHKIKLERKVTEMLTKVHIEAENKERELRDGHHKQMIEMASSHQKELENQCKMYEDRIEQLQERARSHLAEKEKKFDESLWEKNENMRRQMINKMQNLLQAHYNETLEVVGSTTGNTPLRPTRMGTLSNLLQDMRSSSYMADSKLHDISNLNTSTLTLQDTLGHTNMSMPQTITSGYPIGHIPAGTSSETIHSVHPNVSHPSTATQLARSSYSVFSVPAVSGCTTFVPATDSVAPISMLKNLTDYKSNVHVATVANRPNSSLFPFETFEQSARVVPVTSEESKATPTAQNTFKAEMNLPMSTSLTPTHMGPADNQDVSSPINTEQGDRKQYLQHYIKMLLDKSPGEPLDVPSPTVAPGYPIPPSSISHLSPILEPSKVSADENKENAVDRIQPNHITSEIALGVINFLNQQLKAEPSPDLIPVKKSKAGKSPQKHVKPNQNQRLPQRQRTTAFQQVRVPTGTKPQQQAPNASNSTLKKSPKKQQVPQLSLKDLETTTQPLSDVSATQVSDVSHMLGTYMNGDTQEAAEKLLLYLAESQNKVNRERLLNSSQMSKSKSKVVTPSKGGPPAWR